jgi:hypothetical protein
MYVPCHGPTLAVRSSHEHCSAQRIFSPRQISPQTFLHTVTLTSAHRGAVRHPTCTVTCPRYVMHSHTPSTYVRLSFNNPDIRQGWHNDLLLGRLSTLLLMHHVAGRLLQLNCTVLCTWHNARKWCTAVGGGGGRGCCVVWKCHLYPTRSINGEQTFRLNADWFTVYL